MNKCTIITDKVRQDYLLNRLSRNEMVQVQQHLVGCADCRNKLKQMRCLIDEMQDADMTKNTPRILWQSIMGKAAVLAVLLSVSVGGYFWLRTTSHKGSSIQITEQPVYLSVDSASQSTDSVHRLPLEVDKRHD